MGGLVAAIMQSPTRVAVAVFLTALLPLLGWFSAALVSLVTLRHGLQRGLNVLVWGLLPSLFWWQVGSDPSNIMVLIIAWCMAATLNQTINWSKTLAIGSAVTILIGALMPTLMPELMSVLTEASGRFVEQWQESSGETVEFNGEGLESFIVASLSMTLFATGLVS